MFGNYKRSLDDKNRVVIPPKFRETLGNKFYVTLGPDKVLEIREQSEFNKYSEKLLSNNMLNKNARKFARILLGNSFELELDKQGRVNLDNNLTKKANITQEITFVGVGNKIEVWDSNAYDEFNKQFEGDESIDEIAAVLLKEGAEL